MKKFTLLLIPVLFIACASNKNTSPKSYAITSACPPQGTCTVEVLNDKSLVLKKGSFERDDYDLADTPGKSVVHFTYTKNRNTQYQDDFYSEEIVFETDSDLSNIKKETAPADVKLLFGVHCFCRGKAGFYQPATGAVQYKNGTITVKIPNDIIMYQLISTIEIAVK